MRHSCNILAFPIEAAHLRLVKSISIEEFCAADEAGEWICRHDVAGFTILEWPRVAMVRCAAGNCVMIGSAGTNMEAYLAEPLAAPESEI